MMERDSFSRAAQRYLDGERFGGGEGAELEPGERAVADRLLAEARAYHARLSPLPSVLDDAVMEAVRRRAPAHRAGPYQWLVAPQTVRVRPFWIPVLAAAALAVWLAPRRAVPVPAATPVAAATPDTVFVHFELAAPQARSVAVAGSFNGWRTDALAMTRGAGGVWSVTVPLAVGEHHYDFVVDGSHWVPDPTAHVQVDDGFGGRNSVIVVGPKGLVRS